MPGPVRHACLIAAVVALCACERVPDVVAVEPPRLAFTLDRNEPGATAPRAPAAVLPLSSGPKPQDRRDEPAGPAPSRDAPGPSATPTPEPSPTPAPTPTPSARPGQGGAGGAGGGREAPPSGGEAVSGTVIGLVGLIEQPVVGATVRTTDGRTVTTGLDGRFTLVGGAPDNGIYAVTHPSFVASTVAGLTGTSIRLHLQPHGLLVTSPPPPLDPAPIVVQGQLVAPDGSPAAGVLVALSDPAGSTGNPVLTGADGRFSMTVRAPGRTVVNGTLLAAGIEGTRWLGVATGISLSPAATTIDFAPATPGADPLTLTPATHRVRVTLDGSAAPGTPAGVVNMVAPDGSSLGLPGFPNDVWVADLPGVRYGLMAEALSTPQSTESTILRDQLPIDFARPETVLVETLLAPPAFREPPTLAPASMVRWDLVTGARGYHVRLADLGGTFLWEGFSAENDLLLAIAAPLPSGTYGLTLSAIDQAGLTTRAIASVPRALRVIEATGNHRRATRQLRITL